MPLYEYRCFECGHRFEKIKTFSAPDEKHCPLCQGAVERLISAPAVQFKGSGFYSTDYNGKTSKPTAGRNGDGASAPASPSAPAKASESTPAPPAKKD